MTKLPDPGGASPLALTFMVIAVVIVIGVLLSGCKAQTVIGPCPPGQCVGPYDLTLSSHREALGL